MKFSAILALGFLTSAGVLAQSTVRVQGKVIDSTGQPVSGSQVTLTDTNSNSTTTVSSTNEGKYSLYFLPQGKDAYTLSAKKGSLTSLPKSIDPHHAPDEVDISIAGPNSARQSLPSTYNPSTNILQSGTPVKLVLQENLSSADATLGQQVAFKVVDDVIVNGYVLIAHGALAKGTVTEVQPKRRMGRAGKLNVNVDYAVMTDGEHAALSAVKDTKGNGRGALVTTGVVAGAIVFFPAAPLFLLMHGKDIRIPEGTGITAFTNGDVRFNLAKFSKVGAGE